MRGAELGACVDAPAVAALPEVPMSSTQLSSAAATEASRVAAVPMRLEVVVVPVADVARAKSF